MDLHNHFQRKVSHDQLFSCLIYDFLFVQLVIGPLFVVTWRGTWQNADTLFDQQFFQGKLEASSIFVLVLGLVISAILVFAQHEIKALALNCSKPWFFIISRFYTIIRFYFFGLNLVIDDFLIFFDFFLKLCDVVFITLYLL